MNSDRRTTLKACYFTRKVTKPCISAVSFMYLQESLEVEARRRLVATEEAEAGVHAAHARSLQEECQAELNQALPALHGECHVLMPLLSNNTVLKNAPKDQNISK